MIIRGRFIGNAPYFTIYFKAKNFSGLVSLLADTGASRTTILDRDAKLLGIDVKGLQASTLPIVGIGGSVRFFLAKDVEIIFASNEGDFRLKQDLSVIQHELNRLPPEETSRILRLPSILGRDIINKFSLSCDY